MDVLGTARRAVIGGSPLPAVALCLASAVVLTVAQARVPTGLLLEAGTPGGDALWPVAVRSALRLLMFTSAAVVLTWRARAVRAETPVWRWFARTAWVAAASAAVAGVADCLTVAGPLAGTGGGGALLAVGVLAACVPMYQGVIRWNRHGTLLAEPGDWLNGLGSLFALTALGALLLPVVGSPVAQWPLWQEQLWLLRLAAETTLLGTAATVLHLGGLRRDARTWALTASLAATVAVELAGVLDPAAAAGNGPLSETGWTLLVVTLAVAAVLRAAPPLARPVTTAAPTAGAFVVLLACVAVLVAAGLSTGALADTAIRTAALAAGIGAVSVSIRGVRLIRLLADLVVHRREALTDDLTGLANRRALHQRLRGDFDAGRELTLLTVDLDGFKQVNDRFGHSVGDELLRRAAAVLRTAAGPHGFSARLGGDEFAVVLPTPSPEAARAVVDTLTRATSRPVVIDGRRLLVRGSIGIAGSRDARDPEQLLALADAAMYRAKAAGGAGAAVHDADATRAAADRALLVEELKTVLGHPDAADGIDPGRLDVHYQPQVGGDGRVVGVEALVRWRHPRCGLLTPDAFLPLVEEYGLVPALTDVVLRQAAGQAVRWRAAGWDLRLSVNLSAVCLTRPALVALVDDVLTATGLPPQRLVLEVTETSIMADAVSSVARLTELSARGVDISIDDYGTGYSSLAYLRDLPAVELKLDRSLVADVGVDRRADDIVAGTVALAHRLGLRVVAEGVETPEVLHALRALGCDETQGYLHARPLPAPELERWLARQLEEQGAHVPAG
ncbi:putative bifunctional diguanylate cyclase/phosphodiesterase [Kineococcus sp. SYSU DK001]|uniref:putative bifunctional diguanylate cyclase/phosphodiesterase n=1 Tax=Kineococcus sp. SYSU DK001 TaxID=3383122 RepID=UPI003D7EF9E0